MFSKGTLRSWKIRKYYGISTLYECVEKLSMIFGCNIWMVCLELNWFVYDPSWMLQHSEFVWTLRSLVWVVFNNFFRIDATDRSKERLRPKRLFFAVSLYPLSFLWTLPFSLNDEYYFPSNPFLLGILWLLNDI